MQCRDPLGKPPGGLTCKKGYRKAQNSGIHTVLNHGIQSVLDPQIDCESHRSDEPVPDAHHIHHHRQRNQKRRIHGWDNTAESDFVDKRKQHQKKRDHHRSQQIHQCVARPHLPDQIEEKVFSRPYAFRNRTVNRVGGLPKHFAVFLCDSDLFPRIRMHVIKAFQKSGKQCQNPAAVFQADQQRSVPVLPPLFGQPGAPLRGAGRSQHPVDHLRQFPAGTDLFRYVQMEVPGDHRDLTLILRKEGISAVRLDPVFSDSAAQQPFTGFHGPAVVCRSLSQLFPQYGQIRSPLSHAVMISD